MRLFGLIVSVVSLAGVIYWASRQEAPSLPGDLDAWLLLLAAVGTYAVATILRAERWLSILREGGGQAPRSDAYGLTYVGLMGNTFLPARGGDGLRVFYMSRRSGRGLRDVTGSLVAERLLDVIVLLTIYVVLAQVILADAPTPDLPGGLALVGIAAGALALLALGAFALRRFGLIERARELIAPLLGAPSRLRSRHGVWMLALTALVWLIEALNLMLIAAAVDFDLDLIGALYVIGLGGIFLLIPAGPGHAGTFDAAVLLGAGAAGASPQLALSFLLMARLVIFVPVAVVGLILVLTRYGWSRAGDAAGSEAPTTAGAGRS